MSKRLSDLDVAKKFTSIMSSATTRGIPFNMSLKKVRSLLTAKRCYFTGIEFRDDATDLKRSFDRIESDLGYTDDNVVPCIQRINGLKADMSYREINLIHSGMQKHFKKQGKSIKELKQRKSKYEPIVPHVFKLSS